MRQVAPFAVFAFFFVLIRLRGGTRRGPWLRADPPIASVPDAFARYGFFAAWAIGLVGIVARVRPLIGATGVLFAAIGLVLALNLGGARDNWNERQLRYLRRGRDPTLPIVPYALMFIGAIWIVGAFASS